MVLLDCFFDLGGDGVSTHRISSISGSGVVSEPCEREGGCDVSKGGGEDRTASA